QPTLVVCLRPPAVVVWTDVDPRHLEGRGVRASPAAPGDSQRNRAGQKQRRKHGAPVSRHLSSLLRPVAAPPRPVTGLLESTILRDVVTGIVGVPEPARGEIPTFLRPAVCTTVRFTRSLERWSSPSRRRARARRCPDP